MTEPVSAKECWLHRFDKRLISPSGLLGEPYFTPEIMEVLIAAGYYTSRQRTLLSDQGKRGSGMRRRQDGRLSTVGAGGPR
jgi:hypothetical protein